MANGPTNPRGFINGPLYDAAHFSTAYLNVPPNMHRLRNAVGLLVGLYLGHKLMDIVSGHTQDGEKIQKKDLPLPLQPLHGLFTYDRFSDDPKQRWMKVFAATVPAILGGIGAGLGSRSFSTKAISAVKNKMTVAAKDFTLMDADRQALYHQYNAGTILSSASAGFGSASGFGILSPSPINYSGTLGPTFSMATERTMANPLIRGLFNAHSPYPFRPTKLVGAMIEYAAGNPDAHPKQLEAYAQGILKSWFKNTKPEQIQEFVKIIEQERNQFLRNGQIPEESAAALAKHLQSVLSDVGLEKTFIKLGLDPREAAIGDMGFISALTHTVGDMFGLKTTERLQDLHKKLHESMEARHPNLLTPKPFVSRPLNYADDIFKKVTLAVSVGTGAATLGAIATAKDSSIEDLKKGDRLLASENPLTHSKEPTKKSPSFSARVGKPKHQVHSKKREGFVNGKMLDAAEGITEMFNANIGAHRVHCAVGLTVGSWLGDKVMEAMTGYTFNGHHVPKEKIWKPLQKIYKTLAFNPHSDHMRDKWLNVVRWGVPGVLGMIAVMQGSKIFFEDRSKELKKARYLDEVEDKATMAQSQPWSYTSAISSLMGFPTGIPMLPLLNYSTNLGTRFSMAAGRKVALPVIGKFWSNNSTLFPFGPSGMVDLLIREAVNNKAYDPELLETYAIGVLKPWFNNVTAEQVEAFVMKVHEVRDKFFHEGGVPEDLQKQLETELKAHFKGTGLEETLEQIGLNPAQATLANNGVSGIISNVLGAGKEVRNINAEYAKGYAARLQNRKKNPSPDKPLSV